MSTLSHKPIIGSNPTLQHLYATLESRLGYWAFLGGRRHFAFYEKDTYWPFPITRALKRMEEHVYKSLQLQPGSRVLDAGCGEGFVAISLAAKGLSVEGIDVVQHHVTGAQQNVRQAGYDKIVNITQADYHHLEHYPDSSFDGVYTMETLCHSTDERKVLSEFHRILRPGGRLAMYEYAFQKTMDKTYLDDMHFINEIGSMPALNSFVVGYLEVLAAEQGFHNTEAQDLTQNTRPLLRLFFVFAVIPYLFIAVFGLQRHFPNATGAVAGWRANRKGHGRYIVTTATK